MNLAVTGDGRVWRALIDGRRRKMTSAVRRLKGVIERSLDEIETMNPKRKRHA